MTFPSYMMKTLRWYVESVATTYCHSSFRRMKGFEGEGKISFAGFNGVIRLWVDLVTELPVRIEVKSNLAKLMPTLSAGRYDFNISVECYNFEWNAALADTLFQPTIPTNYEKMDFPSAAKTDDSAEKKKSAR